MAGDKEKGWAVTVTWEDGSFDRVIDVPSMEEGWRECARQIGIAANRYDGGWRYFEKFHKPTVDQIRELASEGRWQELHEVWCEMVDLSEIDIRLLPREECDSNAPVDMRWPLEAA